MLPDSPFTRDQALGLGLTNRQWRELAHEGFIREVYPGLFVDTALPDTLQLRYAIMRQMLPPDVWVARSAAAWSQGLDLFDLRDRPEPPVIDVVTPRAARRPRHRYLRAHVAKDLTRADLMTIDGLRMTSPLRTAADLARHLWRPDALVAVDAYLNKGLVDRDELQRCLIRWKKRHGIRQAYEILELANPLSQSGGETRTRLRVLDAGLPGPELQIPVVDGAGVERYYLDLGWRRWLLALEYDGEEHHGPDQAEHDDQRRTWIANHGWTIRVYRKEHIFTSSRAFEHDVWDLVRRARAGDLKPGFSLAPSPTSL